MFLKQIRPNDSDQQDDDGERNASSRVPTAADYVFGYLAWLIAMLIPGFHHFYLGNFWRGLLYLFTFNEVFAGWLLDFFEMHVLIQRSVQEHGHTSYFCCCFVSPSRPAARNLA